MSSYISKKSTENHVHRYIEFKMHFLLFSVLCKIQGNYKIYWWKSARGISVGVLGRSCQRDWRRFIVLKILHWWVTTKNKMSLKSNKCSMTIKLQNMVAHAYVILTLTIANVLLHISLNISKTPFLLNKALLAANVSMFWAR